MAAQIASMTCSEEGCDSPRRPQSNGTGWHRQCAKHLRDYYRAYDAQHRPGRKREDQRGRRRGPKLLIVLDLNVPITYRAAHMRVTRWRGPASAHVCPCGEAAQEWSYSGNSHHEQTEERLMFGREMYVLRYSPDPRDYRALCRGCHVRLDTWKQEV